jgi:hypothetical protein
MSAVAYESDHVGKATRRLPAHLYELPEVKGFVAAIASRIQRLEDNAQAVLVGRYLANATHQTLTYIGNMVGMPRPAGPEDDGLYRALICTQIAINTSNGSWPDILRILGLLNASGIRAIDLYPATIQIEYTGATYLDGDRIRTVLTQATAPIAINLTWYESAADAFALAGPGPGLGLGYGKLSTAF